MTETNQTASTPFNIKIPGYQIKRLLGKGGMASVYLAVQESFGRDVAIKVLSPDMAQDKEFSQRFLREAQIVSRLQHPNIVTVYDVGIHDGYHYLSMEYIPGRELREAKYDLPKREVIRIIREVARALDYAHKQGYIHRDVKPENIMLHDNGERVVLMDFGIARMTQVSNTVTKTGKVIGTPHYMSPEQTKGLKVDHRSDIYSLGVVLFQMLAGRLPYDADTAVAVGIKHITDPIPTMPPGLEMFQPIINTCMSKNPAHRYQSAAELIAALDNLNMNAIAVLDARASAKQAKNRVIHDPQAATTAGDAILDEDTRLGTTGTPIIASREPQFTIPPLVHPDRKKYQDRQTGQQQKPRSRFRLFLLLMLLAGSVWAYFNQAMVLTFWDDKVQPQLIPWLVKYELITKPGTLQPPEVASAETPATREQAITTPPAPQQTMSAQTGSTASEQQVATAAPSTDPEPPAMEQVEDQAATSPSSATDKLQQLKAGLQQQPANALELASYYKQALENNPGDLAARNGVSELQEWYHHEIRAALEDKDLGRARLLVTQLQQSFPAVAERPRFHRMITRLAQAETIQLHLDNAADYLAQQVLTEPQGANALAEYKIVLALAPQHPEALKGIRKIRDLAYRKASYHHERGELKQSLAFVNAGLLAAADDKQLLALKAKIGDRVERLDRHDRLNQQAEALFRSGNLVVPAGNNAFDKYSEVLKENPNNLVARAGLRKIEKHLVEYASIYLEENDLEKAEGILKSAKEKFGLTPIIEEVQYKLDKAIEAASPKVTQISFSASKPASLAEMTSQPLKLNKVLYVGFVYKNFKPLTQLQAELYDSGGRVLVTSKKLSINDKQGQHIFYMTLPTTQLANGSYKLELILGASKLLVGTFYNDNSLP